MKNRFGGGRWHGDWEFSFGMPSSCPGEYVEYAVGYMGLEFGEDLNLEVIRE